MEPFTAVELVQRNLSDKEILDARTVLMAIQMNIAGDFKELPMDLELAESDASGDLILTFMPTAGHSAAGIMRILERIGGLGRGNLGTSRFRTTEINGRVRMEFPHY